MLLNEKVKFLQKQNELIILLKLGKVIKKEDKCFQVPKWLASIFKFYYYSGVVFLVLFLIFLFISPYIDELYIRTIVSLFLYLLIECIFFIITPIYNVKCWKTY